MRSIRRVLTLAAVLLFAAGTVVGDQELSPGVEPYVSVNAPVVALVGASIIDGTGRRLEPIKRS